MIGSAVQFGNSERRFDEAPGVVTQEGNEYRRRARRLRGKYGGRPGVLQRKLRELARGGEGESSNLRFEISKGEKAQGLQSLGLAGGGGAWGQGRAWEFAERVAGRIEGGVLRYSQRVALIREAEGLGIRRFDANLIIAIVQQRMGRVGAGEDARKESRGWKGWWLAVGAVLGVQMVIAGMVWWVMR